MSVPGRALNRTNASTERLWQIAEAGDLTELDAVLKKGADLNGCNRNGVSALMRASSAGNHHMVQALLEHGADIHAHRNDGFNAILLATFFGHFKTVRVLVEHGADLDQTTRCGNTPEDWARARAFEEIALYLNDARRNRRTPAPPFFKQSAERPVPKPVVVEGVFSDQNRKQSAAPVLQAEPELDRAEVRVQEVRTLKDPPEIWELVHSAPPQFNPGTAFISRATSSWTNRILLCLFLCLLAGAGTFGILRFRNAPRALTTRPVEIAQPAPASGITQSTSDSTQSLAPGPTELSPATTPGVQTGAAPATVSAEDSVSTAVSHASTNGRSPGRRTKVPNADYAPDAKESVKAANEVQPVAPKPERTVDSADAQNRKKSTPNGLSPQLIGPASPGATPKPKVIQWP
ncbi:MAG TPA: ankyrin repeat domain-containing protein [Pyrinomonadaceae bacterium]|nr:ankyrin repeat domain-containing protein [Pyrinomonadaceae bacterium]